ncbi:MAG: LysM peptidoglycan-binding domain-containing protein [bacterium]
MKKLFLLSIIGVILISANVGCGILNKKNKEWKPIEPQRTSFVHIIKLPGETLQIIAKWYTGDSKNWTALADANPIINPDRIFVGNHIFIPKDLLKTRKPLPKEFITAYYQKPKQNRKKEITQSKSTPPSNVEDEFILFGPK